MKRNLLLTPGPTQIPPNVCAALGEPIIHHRTPQFQEHIKNAIEGLQAVLQTKNEIYLLASSGTGAMEATVCNLLSPGDKAITVDGGKFGERWADLCRAYEADPQVVNVEWGQTVDPELIRKMLADDPSIKAVFVTLNETSTGVVADIKSLGAVVKETNAVLVVDGVSGVGVVDMKVDAWSVDVAVSASHKGFMLPPGLAFVSVSDKAYKIMETSTNRRFYFDLRKSKKTFANTDTPFTPAIGIVVALNKSLEFLRQKPLDEMFGHYERLAKGTRAAALALGLTLLADESCISNVLTAIHLPDSVDGGKLVKIMRDTHGISMAGGQGHLKGKIIRIAHMGCLDEYDILTCISCLEKVLKELGYNFTLGAGLSAAHKVFNT